MGDPEIRNDEKVLMRTPGIYVKSIPFEGILTNKRVILVDRAKNLLPPKEIPLATIMAVESGENAIRDQIITLSVMAKTGDIRQMILTFSRREGGNRIKERDAWVRVIRENLGSTSDTVIRQATPGTERTPPAAPAAPRRISIVSTPVRPSVVGPATPAPVPPTPASPTYSPPTAPVQHIFCSRCGNKVPADSAFCNRCGSPIVPPGAPLSAPPRQAVQPPPPIAAPAVQPQRPIDQDIRAIEPLIERSQVRIPSDPLRTPVPEVPVQQSLEGDLTKSPAPAPEAAESLLSPPAEKPAEPGFTPQPIAPPNGTQAPSSSVPAAAPPVPAKSRRSFTFAPSRNLLLGIGAFVLIVIIVAMGALFVYPVLTSGETAAPDTTTTPSSSSTTSSGLNPSGTIVPVDIGASNIPQTGVYVHVNYLGGFKGTYGMPDALTTVPGNSGDRVWEVEDAKGSVVAEFEKLDGSGHELLVEIYNNGVLLANDSTSVGHGSVKLSADITA